jgi:hypothetical protein
VFSSAVFELGLVGLGDYAATPRPDTLEVVTLETTPMTARLLLVYRDASDLPRAAIVELGAGGPPTATPMDLMGWAPPGTLMSSQLAVVRDPAGGAYIGSLEISQEGTNTLVTKYAAHVERSGVFTPADGTTFRSNLAFTDRPTGVSSVIVSYDMVSGSAGAPHMAAIVTTDNGTGTLRDGLYLIGLRTGHFEESALFVPSPGRANRGVSGTAGALMVGASRSSLTWWNGGVGGRERFLAIDALSTHRSGAASGTDGGRSLGFTAAPTGGATISAYRVECDAASCSTGAATVLTTAADLGASGGGDALLSADHVGGPSFMVVGRSSMGLGGLVTTLVDLGSMVPTASSVVLPIGELGTANDIDIGIGLTSLPPSTTVLTVGFGMTTGDRVRFGAVRVCSSM